MDTSLIDQDATQIPPEVLYRGIDPSSFPPQNSTVTAPGALVTVQGLQSERGQMLNGRCGEVGGLTANGRVELQLYSQRGNLNSTEQVPMDPTAKEGISAKPENLALREATCYTYYVAMMNRGRALAQAGRFKEAMTNFERIVTRNSGAGAIQTYAGMLLHSGKLQQSVDIMRYTVADWSADDPNRNKVLYQLSDALLQLGHAEEALHQAHCINPAADPLFGELQLELLLKGSSQILRKDAPGSAVPDYYESNTQRWEACVKACRTVFELEAAGVENPRNKLTVPWNLAAALCHLKKYEEGIQIYEGVLNDYKTELSPDQMKRLQSDLEFAHLQWEGQAEGQPVLWMTHNGGVVTLESGDVELMTVGTDGIAVVAQRAGARLSVQPMTDELSQAELLGSKDNGQRSR